jgi:hypothetical protein
VVKKFVFASAMLAAITVVPFTSDVAAASGCPATSSRWEEYSVAYVGKLLYKEVGAWSTKAAAIAEIDQRFDRNGDDHVCLTTRWDDLNPQSNWDGFTLYLVADNSANATE